MIFLLFLFHKYELDILNEMYLIYYDLCFRNKSRSTTELDDYPTNKNGKCDFLKTSSAQLLISVIIHCD